RSDPILLARMLKNLVTNAIRYTDRGGIVVGCRRLGPDRLRVAVVDSGVGIAIDEQKRIFEEYYQVTGASGPGLGLPIVTTLAQLLGHGVTVSYAVGRGSTFAIELERAAEAAPPPIELDLSARWTLAGLNVVLVDDDAEIRNGVRMLLESWGCGYIGGA